MILHRAIFRCRIGWRVEEESPPGFMGMQLPSRGSRWRSVLLSRYFSAVYIHNFPIADRLL